MSIATNDNKNFNRKISLGFVFIFLLAVSLAISTFALAYATVSVENNYFRTGIVKININDGEPIIQDDEFLFEPGMTVNKDFFVENLSTWDVYYKIYFTNVSGELADILQVTLYDGEDVLFVGTPRELENFASAIAKDPLSVMEKHAFTVSFHYPEAGGNNGMSRRLSFDMCVRAVQTKNNPDRDFG